MGDDQFAHTPEYQLKILSFMLHDPHFCDVIGDALQAEDFGDKVKQFFFETLKDADPKLTQITLREELIRASKTRLIKEEDVSAYVTVFKQLQAPPNRQEKDYIQKQLQNFVRAQAVKRVLVNSIDLIKNNEFDSISQQVIEATSKGVDIMDLGMDYFEEYRDRAERRKDPDHGAPLPWNIPELDLMTYGGLKQGQLGLVVGGTGRGKSILLQWLGRSAVLLNKTVVYFTMELSQDQIAERYDAMWTRIRPHELKTYEDDFLEEFNPLAAKYANRLWVKKFPAGKASVYTLEHYLQVLASRGVSPDLVIVDYLDLLKAHTQRFKKYEELEDTTTYLYGMAESFSTRIVTATQMNRLGFTMETPDETAVSGAVAKLFAVDLAVFMAQTREEREDEIMRLYVPKNRNGPAGRTITLDTDYSYMTFYRETQTIQGKEDDTEILVSERDTEDDDQTTDVFLLQGDGIDISSDGF